MMNNVQAQVLSTTALPPTTNMTECMEVQEDNEDLDDNSDSSSSSSSSSSDSSDEGSSSSDQSSSSSSDSDEGQDGNAIELAQITNEVLQLPRDLCEYPSVFREFFTEDLWSEMTIEQRLRLQEQLPNFNKLLDPAEALAEQQHTVQLLFQDRIQRFGRTPLTELHRNLEAGHYRPDVKVLRTSIAKSQKREQRFRECERVGRLAKRLFIAREHLLRKAYSSTPNDEVRFEKLIQKQQQHHSYLFNSDTKISAVRARKRFHAEIAALKKQSGLTPPNNLTPSSSSTTVLSADEEDKNDDDDTVMHLTPDWHAEEAAALKSAATFAASTDKCIYDTFFQRRKDYTDEEAMRLSQYAKRPKLSNRNFREYLNEYKRKKLIEPNLPDYETSDIRLRDVCARAQIGGNFKRAFPLGQKPGRKAKLKQSEPPALVPIQNFASKSSSQLPVEQHKPTSVISSVPNTYDECMTSQNDAAAFNIFDGDVELQQVEVETYAEEIIMPPCVVGNEIVVPASSSSSSLPMVTQLSPRALPNNTPPGLVTTVRALPKLEPINQKMNTTPIRDKIKSSLKINALAAGGGIYSKGGTINLNPVLKKIQPPSSGFSSVGHVSELIQETHACFFALIRDFFCATPNHRMKFDELKQRIQIWLNNPITALNDWYAQASNWSALLTSAVKFLAGDFVEQPEEYVPYIDYKAQLNIYQWIGAGRDSDARLTILCNYWMEHRKELHTARIQTPVIQAQQQQPQQQQQQLHHKVNVIRTGQLIMNPDISTSESTGDIHSSFSVLSPHTTTQASATPPPPPRCPTTWTIRSATSEEVQEFRRQERERFEQPHRAYTYRMNGYESIVGPVRGIYSQTLALTKARGHSMMVDDRPNFVTILTLVRDATARLPNGEGTRSDISELLKCSQYINPEASENVMQTIVSGALDRLHTETDPCVRYDPKRKIWIYLHRNRSEIEFERMHQQQQGQPKPVKCTKTTIMSGGNPEIVTSPLNTTRKMVTNKTIIKTLSQKDGIIQIQNNKTLPALVPANSNPIIISSQGITSVNRLQQQQQQQILTKNPIPVPPLKYNLPSPVAASSPTLQQQKSLLKTNLNTTHRRIIDAKTGATVITTGQKSIVQNINSMGKPLGFPLSQGKVIQTGGSSNNTTSSGTISTSTPFIVTTTGGVQTLHVSNPHTISTAAHAQAPLTATVAGKRVALSKPIIINQITGKQQPQQQSHQTNVNTNRAKTPQIITQKTITQQQQHQHQQKQHIQPHTQTQGYIMPLNATNSNVQLQLLQGNSTLSPNRTSTSLATTAITTTQKTSNVHTIVVDPNSAAFSGVNTSSPIGEVTGTGIKTTPKNIIRFVPNTSKQQNIVGNKLIGQRLITTKPITNNNSSNPSGTVGGTVTVRGGAKILTSVVNNNNLQTIGSGNETTATLLPNNSTIVSTTSVVGGVGGTIIKMSPQAFTALQQKQQIQHVVKANNKNVTIAGTTQQQQQQKQQQQRLIIGNTAIIAHGGNNTTAGKNVIIQQATPKQTAVTGTSITTKTLSSNMKSVDAATSTTGGGGIITGSNKIQLLNAANLTPQQQRMLIQNLKQQQQQNQQQNITTKPLTVVVSQAAAGGMTRILKTTPARDTIASGGGISSPSLTTTTSSSSKMLTANTTGGQIITIDGLLQQNKSQQQTENNSSNSGTIITPISTNQFAVSQSQRNIITIGNATQQRLVTTQAASGNTVTTTAAAAGVGVSGSNIRVIQTANSGDSTSGTNSGPTTFSIANIQGKQVVFATKAPSNVKQIANLGQTGATTVATSTGLMSGSVIIGGQTLKLQGNNIQTLTKGGNSNAATSAGNIITQVPASPQVQTVIMGNQILRITPQSLITNKSVVNKSDSTVSPLQNRLVAVGGNNSNKTTATLPKTLVLGSTVNSSGTQTLRLQNATTATTTGQQQETTQKTTGNNRVVLAVQGGGQILLPSNFTTGGTLNLKALQNMKLVSLTQVPQQLQDKSKPGVSSATVVNTSNPTKTLVKTVANNNGTAIG